MYLGTLRFSGGKGVWRLDVGRELELRESESKRGKGGGGGERESV